MARPKLDKPRYKLFLRGSVYHLYYTKDGQTVRESTRCSSREEAEEYLASFIAEAEKIDEPASKSVASILDGYLQDRDGVVADFARLQEVSKNLKHHLGWIQIGELKRSTSSRYIATRRHDGVGDGTIRRELGTLRAALNWAIAEEWIDKAPSIQLPPAPPPRERWLSEDEVTRMLAACPPASHIRLFLLVALNTAARKGAILDLEWSRVDLDLRRINFNPVGRRRTSKARTVVPINDTLLEALKEAASIRTCAYVIEWGGAQVASIKTSFRRTVQRAGLGPDVTPHVLRHTAATRMAMAGESMEKIQRMLGHVDLATTSRIYAHWHPDWLKSTADTLG